MGKRPHLLITPYPVQGHVAPLLKFAHLVADHGIKVTFLISEFRHAKLLALQSHEPEVWNRIGLASIPDGLDPDDDRKDIAKLLDSTSRVMPEHLGDFIEKVNGSKKDEQITCVIADIIFGGWPMEVAKKMGIEGVPFCPFGPGALALSLHIPNLIEARIVNSTDGSPLTDELVFISKDIPVMNNKRLPWCCPGDLKVQEAFFRMFLGCNRATDLSKRLLCNCVYELDPAACELIPNILPIGPLLATYRLGNSAGIFRLEDSTCTSWLDGLPAGSVIYVAFGTTPTIDQHQFNELALGLELYGGPFLWVVRSGFNKESSADQFPDGFIERVAGHGKIVSWAPQEKVLAHPAVACFLSHCGWNSTMEGIAMGIPFLCWPYFAEQFHNQSYICDKWGVGLGLNSDENGFISRHEIKKKIERLVSDDGIKANAEKLKEMSRKSVSEDGSSYKHFRTFAETIANA